MLGGACCRSLRCVMHFSNSSLFCECVGALFSTSFCTFSESAFGLFSALCPHFRMFTDFLAVEGQRDYKKSWRSRTSRTRVTTCASSKLRKSVTTQHASRHQDQHPAVLDTSIFEAGNRQTQKEKRWHPRQREHGNRQRDLQAD